MCSATRYKEALHYYALRPTLSCSEGATRVLYWVMLRAKRYQQKVEQSWDKLVYDVIRFVKSTNTNT